jgi:hypothetical protein
MWLCAKFSNLIGRAKIGACLTQVNFYKTFFIPLFGFNQALVKKPRIIIFLIVTLPFVVCTNERRFIINETGLSRIINFFSGGAGIVLLHLINYNCQTVEIKTNRHYPPHSSPPLKTTHFLLRMSSPQWLPGLFLLPRGFRICVYKLAQSQRTLTLLARLWARKRRLHYHHLLRICLKLGQIHSV